MLKRLIMKSLVMKSLVMKSLIMKSLVMKSQIMKSLIMKRRILPNRPFILWPLCFFMLICAQAQAETETQTQTQTQTQYRATMDVVYGHRAGMALVYHVLEPVTPNGAAVIFINSGGWVSPYVPLRKDQANLGMFGHMLAAGYTVYSVNHGSAPYFKVPQAVSDVRGAVRHIKQHSAKYQVDPKRLGVFGGSAGGQLALMLGLNAEAPFDRAPEAAYPSLWPEYSTLASDDATVAVVVAWFPPVDLRQINGRVENYPALDFSDELAVAVSPILYVSAGDPPTLLIHGTADTVVPPQSSELLAAELKRVGVTFEHRVIEGGAHSFPNPAHAAEAAQATVAWFMRYL